jgi:hypothetical protein
MARQHFRQNVDFTKYVSVANDTVVVKVADAMLDQGVV